MGDRETAFACDMLALAPEDRAKHTQTIHALFGSVVAVQELADGYAFRLPEADGILLTSVTFIANEKHCCPFFQFDLRIEPAGRAQWLHLTGPPGVKPFIRAEVGGSLRGDVRAAAGFSGTHS
jgi:hypothetical protein